MSPPAIAVLQPRRIANVETTNPTVERENNAAVAMGAVTPPIEPIRVQHRATYPDSNSGYSGCLAPPPAMWFKTGAKARRQDASGWARNLARDCPNDQASQAPKGLAA